MKDTAPQSPSATEQLPPKEVTVAAKLSPRRPNIILDDSSRHSKLLFKSDAVAEDRGEMCPLQHPGEVLAQSVYSEDVGSPEKDDKKSKADESTNSTVSDSNQPQPWELVIDPFVPIGIEQVCVCVCERVSV